MDNNLAEYKQEMFFVINKKRIEEVSKETAEKFVNALYQFSLDYERETGHELKQKYFVVNQDEPYAKDVLDFILKCETEKLTKHE
jgi:hypothetical protein